MRKPERLAAVNILGFLATIVLNGLANALPINGKTTGDISDLYPNLFVPAGFTFAIWGVIYTGLFLFIIYQSYVSFASKADRFMVSEIGWWFCISSLANCSWILSWHYILPEISLIVMIILLYSLARIYLIFEEKCGALSQIGRIFIRPVFSIYFGWICVATIANVTAVLVSWGWNGGGLGEEIWTITMMTIAVGFGIYFSFYRSDYLFTLVVLWALYGIYMKRLSFNGTDHIIVYAAQVGLLLSAISITYTFSRKLIGQFSR